MDIVEFLEARIAEEEAPLRHAEVDATGTSPGLADSMLAECAEKRTVLARWKLAEKAESGSDTTDAQGELVMARRSMLNILAAGYADHPDFDPDWATALD